jgi:hypothetical protein
MPTYKQYMKLKDGSLQELPLDAETLGGKTSSEYQTKLTAGTGITIAEDGTISVSFDNGDIVAYGTREG